MEKDEREEKKDDGNMPFVAHLEELRQHLIRSFLAIITMSLISYCFIEEIMAFLIRPVGRLYYLQPAEAFFTYLKIAVYSGFIFALPFIFFEIWRFVLPALTVKERLAAIILVPASVVLFLVGLGFSFFFVLPFALRFFGGFSSDAIQPFFSIAHYFDFVFSFVLPFGFIFELPLLLIAAAKFGLISSVSLGAKRRYVIFFSFVIGAVLTPPDVFTQTMIALPLIVLYEISFFLVKYILRK